MQCCVEVKAITADYRAKTRELKKASNNSR